MIPPKIEVQQSNWQAELICKADSKTRELLLCIPRYIKEQVAGKELHRNRKYYNPKTINFNEVPIPKEWIDRYSLFSTLNDERNKVLHFNKALRNLEGADVLAKKDKDVYILNPLYYCASPKHYVDSYMEWCRVTNSKPLLIHLENSVYEYNGSHKVLDDANIKEVHFHITNNILIYNP